MRNEEVYVGIEALRRRGGRGVLATITQIRGSSPASLGAKMLIVEGQNKALGTVGGGCVDGQVWAEAQEVLKSGVPSTLEIDLTDRDNDPNHGLICGGLVSVFLEPLMTDRVYICGAGHVGQALAHFVDSLHFATVVIDDRAMFASAERFPKAKLHVGRFDVELPKLKPDGSASIVIVTRGHQYDEACLRWAIEQPVRYIGLIGSKVKISKLFARLMKDGVPSSVLETVRAPVGLDIGAVTVEEIALSIAAELVAFRRFSGAPSRSLKALGASQIPSLQAARKALEKS